MATVKSSLPKLTFRPLALRQSEERGVFAPTKDQRLNFSFGTELFTVADLHDHSKLTKPTYLVYEAASQYP